MVVIVCCMCSIIRISFLCFAYAYIIYLFYAIVKPKRRGFHPTRKHVGFRRKFITKILILCYNKARLKQNGGIYYDTT